MMNMRKNILILLIMLSTSAVMSQSLSFDSCWTMMCNNNAQLQNAQLEVERAKLVKKEAATNYFPKASGNVLGYKAMKPLVEYGIEDVENAQARDWLYNFYMETGQSMGLPNTIAMCEQGLSLGATALQPIYMGGQIVNGNKLAKVGVEAAEGQKVLTEKQQYVQLAQSYWLVVSLQEKQKTVEQALRLIDTLYRDVQTAVAAGLTTSNDLLKVTMKRNELLSAQLQVNNGVVLSKMALCQLIGVQYTPDVTLTGNLTADTTWVRRSSYTDEVNLEHRVESQLLRLNVSAEKLKRKMLIGETLPHLMIGASTAYGNMIFDKYSYNTLGFATLQVPITDWWATSYKIKQQNIAVQKAVNDQRDLTEKMALEMTQLWNQVEEMRQQLILANSTVEYAKQNLESVRTNYEAGVVAISELLEAQTLYRQALDQQTDASINYKLSAIKYKQVGFDGTMD